jgi:hypothetical protein
MERMNMSGPGEGGRPGEGPLDRPERGANDPIGDDAYPGGTLPPTADMDDPIPETGMPGEPTLDEQDQGEDTPA